VITVSVLNVAFLERGLETSHINTSSTMPPRHTHPFSAV